MDWYIKGILYVSQHPLSKCNSSDVLSGLYLMGEGRYNNVTAMNYQTMVKQVSVLSA